MFSLAGIWLPERRAERRAETGLARLISAERPTEPRLGLRPEADRLGEGVLTVIHSEGVTERNEQRLGCLPLIVG